MLAVTVPLGILAALRRGGAADLGLGLVSYAGVSMPEFVIATIVLMIALGGEGGTLRYLATNLLFFV